MLRPKISILISSLVLFMILANVSFASDGAVRFERAKLLPSDVVEGDEFGYSISLCDGIAVIGTPNSDDLGIESGAAYIFRYDPISSSWIEEAKLLASDGSHSDRFGRAVSISGETVLISSIYADGVASLTGAAYVFRYDPVTATWNEEVKLFASDGEPYEQFGNSVSISGQVAAIAAECDDDNGHDSGSAYVFRYDPVSRTWTEEDKLLSSDGYSNDRFGVSIAASDNAVLVGAYYADHLIPNYNDNAGACYVFRFDPGSSSWVEEAKLVASDAEMDDRFGGAAALSSHVAVIGVDGDDDNGGLAGSAYVFRYNPASKTWNEEDKLLASDGDRLDRFGMSVGISGSFVIVGAQENNDFETSSGSAYVFYDDAGQWIEVFKLLASDGEQGDRLGNSVACSGDEVLVGAFHDDNNGADTGSMYIFDLAPTFSLATTPTPLIAGQYASFIMTDGNPFEKTYLVYTLGGYDHLYVFPLDAWTNLTQPILAAGGKYTDFQGTVVYNLFVPTTAAGYDIWLQALQYGLASDVRETSIQ